MNASLGILTARGGATRPALAPGGMGRACNVGCSEISIDYQARLISVTNKAGEGVVVKAGEIITINGSGGTVYKGDVKKIDPEFGGELDELLMGCERYARLKMRTNADTPSRNSAQSPRSATIHWLARKQIHATCDGKWTVRQK
jgi:pyruvate, orthophosphate dikinase